MRGKWKMNTNKIFSVVVKPLNDKGKEAIQKLFEKSYSGLGRSDSFKKKLMGLKVLFSDGSLNLRWENRMVSFALRKDTGFEIKLRDQINEAMEEFSAKENEDYAIKVE